MPENVRPPRLGLHDDPCGSAATSSRVRGSKKSAISADYRGPAHRDQWRSDRSHRKAARTRRDRPQMRQGFRDRGLVTTHSMLAAIATLAPPATKHITEAIQPPLISRL